jgi:hypothetical protein
MNLARFHLRKLPAIVSGAILELCREVVFHAVLAKAAKEADEPATASFHAITSVAVHDSLYRIARAFGAEREAHKALVSTARRARVTL